MDQTPALGVGRLFEPAYAREVVPEVWTVPDASDIRVEVRRVLRPGLPATIQTAGRLQYLSGVLARSPRLDEAALRVVALNRVFEAVITKLEAEPALASGAPALFGLAPGTTGTTLTVRRERAAVALGYDPEYLRKHLESRIVAAVAEGLRTDTLRYHSRTLFGGYDIDRHERPATDGSPSVEPEDLVHREELSARIWSAVYLLRAEFIAVGLAKVNKDGSRDFDAATDNALYAMALQLHLLDQYVSTYGERIMRSGLEHHVDYLVRIAGWHPPFSAAEAAHLRMIIMRAGAGGLAGFQAAIEATDHGRSLLTQWRKWMTNGWKDAHGDPK
ncbi:hypothetical protein ACG83_00040 [Frankia sp. R43]|nr:hypothetical protein ACG83_00040 [Frankia sp. R43]